jgi:hypothetical protein
MTLRAIAHPGDLGSILQGSRPATGEPPVSAPPPIYWDPSLLQRDPFLLAVFLAIRFFRFAFNFSGNFSVRRELRNGPGLVRL